MAVDRQSSQEVWAIAFPISACSGSVRNCFHNAVTCGLVSRLSGKRLRAPPNLPPWSNARPPARLFLQLGCPAAYRCASCCSGFRPKESHLAGSKLSTKMAKIFVHIAILTLSCLVLSALAVDKSNGFNEKIDWKLPADLKVNTRIFLAGPSC